MTAHSINPIRETRFTSRFERQYKNLPKEIKAFVDEAIKGLTTSPIPKKLRFEKLSGLRNPSVYSIHATPNHSHKITLTIEDGVAFLREIATHKQIDRRP